MLIPADFFTQERIDSDLDILKLYYNICEELNLTNDPKVRKTFVRLSKVAGKPIFLKESILLAQFINRRIGNKDDKGDDFYYKIY